jgi:hypothetical protein
MATKRRPDRGAKWEQKRRFARLWLAKHRLPVSLTQGGYTGVMGNGRRELTQRRKEAKAPGRPRTGDNRIMLDKIMGSLKKHYVVSSTRFLTRRVCIRETGNGKRAARWGEKRKVEIGGATKVSTKVLEGVARRKPNSPHPPPTSKALRRAGRPSPRGRGRTVSRPGQVFGLSPIPPLDSLVLWDHDV